ncbi:MAG: YafY family protein [Gallionella sp.]|nr:YafY family protein [Gallionella sp.]
MSMNERLYKIDQMLSERRFVTFDEMLARLEVSRATLKRDLAYMRDRLKAPIIFDRELRGYRFDKIDGAHSAQYALPGLWFSAEEIHALLTMQHLLSNLDTSGLLGPHISPLLSRLTALLCTAENPADEVQKRIKLKMIGARKICLEQFQTAGSALLRRKRLMIDYHARGTNETTHREVSPQRLVYYHGNWYLDAWCHLRNSIRNFSVDAIQHAEILEKKAKDISDKKLDDVLGAGYGIFSGAKVQWATLLFTPELARWVAVELWHPKQKGKFYEDGSYELKIPYSNDSELVMDILKCGSGVKVIHPKELRQHVIVEIDAMKLTYL